MPFFDARGVPVRARKHIPTRVNLPVSVKRANSNRFKTGRLSGTVSASSETADLDLTLPAIACEFAAAFRFLGKSRSVPPAAKGLYQQHRVRHTTPQNIHR